MPQNSPKPLPFQYQFIAGAIAGVSEILTFYPLGMYADALFVKTRLQLQSGKAEAGVVGTLRNIVVREGFWRLYRGLLPPLLMEAPKRAVKFGANDFWGKTFLSISGSSQMTQPLSVITGAAAGATESIVVVPFELIKIKLQDKSSTFKGPADVLVQIIKKEGILGIYTGMESTFWRHLTWNAGYFGSIFQVRAMLPKAETGQGKLMNNLIAGTIGGFIGTALNTPFDVVKSRIQGATKVPGIVPKYNWTIPSLFVVAREEGLSALYKGFVPKVLRLAPGGGVLLLVVEFTLNAFRQMLGPPYI
ncbi:organic acid transporter [Dacryopinax primogenitus]|uniref:Organic acid transporter n=1 Tax=Dacryopinax primogenitus (strain DJM 731) TaxID=1858805 RepID=M5G052_DACPD|nr:organic acid transporter [Dacryopinax primogenitus]EJT97157.1 organic acid transporter [Dacryopinax primogenitus]